MSEQRKVLPFGLKDLREASQPDRHKISAFQVAPTRKTAFEKAKEQAQQKADREAAETAAAYQDFIAEYGADDDKRYGHDSHRRDQVDRRHQDRGLRANEPSLKRNHDEYAGNHDRQQHLPSGFDGNDSEEEEKERRRLKLKSSANFLNELKQTNRKRELLDSRNQDHRIQDTYNVSSTSSRGQSTTQRSSEKAEPSSNVAHVETSRYVTDSPRTETPDQSEEEESSDEIDFYRTRPSSMTAKQPLGKISKAHLQFLLKNTTARRGSIARVTAFAMTHASSAEHIAEMICDSVELAGMDWKLAIARLWCVSDILHNSWIPIPNVWKYRSHFEMALVKVFGALKEVGETIESRIRKENFRRLVTANLEIWSTWICFSDGVVDQFLNAFDDKKIEEEVVEEAKQQKKSGGWKKFEDSATDNNTSGMNHIDVDGEAIDLDGEEIDLEAGTSISCDATNSTGIIQQREVEQAVDRDHYKDSSREKPVITVPKIKLSFGKIKLPARVKRDLSGLSESDAQAEVQAGDYSPQFTEGDQVASGGAPESTGSEHDTTAGSINDLRAYEQLEKESNVQRNLAQVNSRPMSQDAWSKKEGQYRESSGEEVSQRVYQGQDDKDAGIGEKSHGQSESEQSLDSTMTSRQDVRDASKDRKRQRRSAADFM